MIFVSLRTAFVPFVTYFFVVLLLLTACTKKEVSVETLPCSQVLPSPHRIVHEDNYSSPDTVFTQGIEYAYDIAGRLKYEITSTSWGGPMDTLHYAYSPDKVIASSGNQYFQYEGYDLNELGLAVSNYNYHLVFWHRNYDLAGYVTRQESGYNNINTIATYYYSCFNLAMEIIQTTENSGIRTDTNWYEYYPAWSNTTGTENRGSAFLGKQSNLLLKSVRSTINSPIGYTYVFDSLGRVKWRIWKDNQGNEAFTKYTYL